MDGSIISHNVHPYGTEVSRLGTDRSSMEALLLTCLQAKLLWGRVQINPQMTMQLRNDLLYEIKQITPKKCYLDAKVEPKERTNTHKVKEQTNGTYSD